MKLQQSVGSSGEQIRKSDRRAARLFYHYGEEKRLYLYLQGDSKIGERADRGAKLSEPEHMGCSAGLPCR